MQIIFILNITVLSTALSAILMLSAPAVSANNQIALIVMLVYHDERHPRNFQSYSK
jgi:hypothetical protein